MAVALSVTVQAVLAGSLITAASRSLYGPLQIKQRAHMDVSLVSGLIRELQETIPISAAVPVPLKSPSPEIPLPLADSKVEAVNMQTENASDMKIREISVSSGKKVSGPAVAVDTGTAGHSQSATLPRYREHAMPDYLHLASDRSYEGVVPQSAEVLKDGTDRWTQAKEVVRIPVLDRSTVEALRRWRFEPGRVMGAPLATWVDVPLRAALQE
jgi:outer membrane biosynthesis protein TonB